MEKIAYSINEIPSDKPILLYGDGSSELNLYGKLKSQRKDIFVKGFLTDQGTIIDSDKAVFSIDDYTAEDCDIVIISSHNPKEKIECLAKTTIKNFIVFINEPRHFNERDRTRRYYNQRKINFYQLPVDIQLETFFGCNIRCPMCAFQMDPTIKRKPAQMSLDVFNAVADNLSGVKRNIGLNNMGEPLLNKNLCNFVGKLKNLGHRTWFTTNGTLLTKDIGIELAKSKIDQVIFSVDAFSEKKYSQIRVGAKRDVVFDNIINFAESMRKYNPMGIIRIDSIVCDLTFDEMDALALFCKKNNFAFNPIGLSGWGGFSTPKHFGKDRYSDYTKQASFHCGLANEIKYPGKHPCYVLWDFLNISAEGNLLLCCQDYKGSSNMPNVLEKSLKRIWNEDFGKLRAEQTEGVFRGVCEKCLPLGPFFFLN